MFNYFKSFFLTPASTAPRPLTDAEIERNKQVFLASHSGTRTVGGVRRNAPWKPVAKTNESIPGLASVLVAVNVVYPNLLSVVKSQLSANPQLASQLYTKYIGYDSNALFLAVLAILPGLVSGETQASRHLEQFFTLRPTTAAPTATPHPSSAVPSTSMPSTFAPSRVPSASPSMSPTMSPTGSDFGITTECNTWHTNGDISCWWPWLLLGFLLLSLLSGGAAYRAFCRKPVLNPNEAVSYGALNDEEPKSAVDLEIGDLQENEQPWILVSQMLQSFGVHNALSKETIEAKLAEQNLNQNPSPYEQQARHVLQWMAANCFSDAQANKERASLIRTAKEAVQNRQLVL
jgi:hypothetical protein